MSRPCAFAFGPYVLDPAERRLLRGEEAVPLSPRLLAVLTRLVERAGHLVTKDELIEGAWGDAVVEENALPVAVSRLRSALGRETPYIETVVGHGYRFVAPVARVVTPGCSPAAAAPPGPWPAPPARVRTDWRRPLSALVLAVAVVVAVFALGGAEGTDASPEDFAAMFLAEAPAEVPLSDPRWTATEAVSYGEMLLAMRRGLPEALAAFERAAELDPTNAQAFLGIAGYYAMGADPMAAEAALGRALALDPGLGEAHATLGFVLGMQRWDWEGARIAFERALQHAPDHPRTHQWHAVYLIVHRRFAEAEAAAERAIALDPLSANLHSDLCEVRLAQRDFAGARAACERALALDPGFFFAQTAPVLDQPPRALPC
jgi:DNA-binding winged helix-turn-helix (wHTH) protein/Flp pilus assembly protein TadD